jgi:hypothetical protein
MQRSQGPPAGQRCWRVGPDPSTIVKRVDFFDPNVQRLERAVDARRPAVFIAVWGKQAPVTLSTGRFVKVNS